MATNQLKWKTVVENTCLTTATELKNITNTSFVAIAGVIDNRADLYQYIQFHLKMHHQSAPTAGIGAYSLWFIQSYDGTNYEDASSAISKPPDIIVPCQAVATSYEIVWPAIPTYAPPTKFKILFQNISGQTTENSNDNNHIYYSMFVDDVQAAT